MSRQLLVKPLTEKAVEQPLEKKADELETSLADFEYRAVPSPRILTVQARIQTISVGKPMPYDFTEKE